MKEWADGCVRYALHDDGTFVVDNYQRAKPFSSFLPGIAGLWGVPLWVYYVNRGQAVACFGTQDKNHAILEFHSAARHWRRVALEGFRTFLRVRRGREVFFHEPFGAGGAAPGRLSVTASALRLEEESAERALAVTVEYFTVPNEPFAALVRTVRIENRSDEAADLEVLDGFPMLVPYGEDAMFLQVMPFITEGYLRIENLQGRVPYVNLKAKPSDTPETEFVRAGNFFCGVHRGAAGARLLAPIVDPGLVFGDMQDFVRPHALAERGAFDPSAPQAQHCMTPCAFLYGRFGVAAGGAETFHALYGAARSLPEAQAAARKATAEGYFARKAEESRLEVEKVKHRLFLHGGSPEINLYGPQTFLDNCLRGGVPVTLPAKGRRAVLHVYSRKHGDLERDYNFFELEPTWFSQGNGNFRDVCQNRRHDVWINPDVGADDVRYFFNLVQPDGFNPLVCKGLRFQAASAEALAAALARTVAAPDRPRVAEFLAEPFSPGGLFAFLEDEQVRLTADPPAVLEELLAVCETVEDAEHGAGYWTDHWFYPFDLLESFLAIFPERLREVLVERRDFVYWDSAVRVLPRRERYVLYAPGRVRHVDSLAEDAEKARLIASRRRLKHFVRTERGTGEVYRSNLLGKILTILAGKVASLSPSGVGLEMDGGRPGWHDSINGLPGLFGATTSETLQLVRVIRLLRGRLAGLALPERFSQPLPSEVAAFVREVAAALRRYLESDRPDRDHVYWAEANAAKEAYREDVRLGFGGTEEPLALGRIHEFLDAAEARIAASLADAIDPESGLYSTYVIHEALEYEPLECVDPHTGERRAKRSARGLPCVRVTRFRMQRLPLFLEAPMHAMRIETDAARARQARQAVRESPLYDRRLGMYLVNAPLPEDLTEIGRIWAWPPGWFEQENVFLHLEHKYLLALLEAGLHEEFFEDLRACLIPFQDVAVFGRSPIENASFIVSSRHPRAAYHGRGFLPRSSGTTAEVVAMLLWMSFGRRPFTAEGGKVALGLAPVLPAWMFTQREETRDLVGWDGRVRALRLAADSYTALFLGRTLVTYLNPKRKDTFGADAARVVRYRLFYGDGREEVVEGDALPEPQALAVRDGRVERMEVLLG